jgi:lipoprotein-anchoring transpeptidase ErfK/SrfK
MVAAEGGIGFMLPQVRHCFRPCPKPRVVAAMLAAILAAVLASVAAPAEARSRRDSFWPPEPREQAEPRERRASLLPARSSGRIVIVVSTEDQKLTVYDDGEPVASTTVSTGVDDHPTPIGIFSVIQKQRYHESNIYSAAPMPFMQRITWSGVALHEGHVTGRPASHGCIRMPHAFAVDLYRYTREGARVVIAREDVSPEPTGLSWPRLPPEARQADNARPSDVPDQPAGEIEAPARTATAAHPARHDIVAENPVSLLVNRRTGKLYVRRAFSPVFDVPITIDDPARPLGTHLLVARDDGKPLDWMSFSLTEPVREASLIDDGRRPRRIRDASLAMPAPPASSASDALARLHLAPGTAAFVASLLSPGASLIISDDGAHGRENWAGTNFIALPE